MNRSHFLISATALAAAAFLRETPLARAGTASETQLEALLSTIIPFGERFPLRDPASFRNRLEALFDLRESAAFQASLAEFASLAAFTTASPQLYSLERSMDEEARPQQLLERDQRAFRESGLAGTASFADLKPEERARYLRLWTQSAFGMRRRFYTSMRAISFEAFYSMPQVWSTIGYDGPILHRGQR